MRTPLNKQKNILERKKTMKTQKKVLALVLTLVLAFVMTASLAVTAFADEATYDIKITSKATGHTFKAYQILTGTVTGEAGDKSLGSPAWGADIDENALMAALNEKYSLTGENEIKDAAGFVAFLNGKTDDQAAEIAKIVAKHIDGSGTALTEAPGEEKSTYTVEGLAAGYYLVKDETDVTDKQDAVSSYMLKVVNDVEMTAKLDYPDVEKDVLDKNDTAGTEAWGKTADHDIGDLVDFKLTGTIPNTAGYKTYYYAFHDKMNSALEFQDDTVEVTVGGIKISTPDYTLTTPGSDGCTFDVVIEDLIKVLEKVSAEEGYDKDKGVVVTYKAKLTKDAVIGNPGQENKVKLEFSNNPNWESDGEEDEPHGETPEKEVVVFTFELDVNKVKEDTTSPLVGAGFTLYKKNSSGTYDELKFSFNEEKGHYVVDMENGQAEFGVGELSEFTFAGLDDGDYKLVETTVPKGYNKAEDIEFTITAKHDDGTKTLLEVKFGDKITAGSGEQLGIGSINVVNNKGTTLPETGGIGTTIFYIIGGLLVVSAGVLLITKHRMNSKG